MVVVWLTRSPGGAEAGTAQGPDPAVTAEAAGNLPAALDACF
jgi:hypothetical protein